jgi:hypothetical protein
VGQKYAFAKRRKGGEWDRERGLLCAKDDETRREEKRRASQRRTDGEAAKKKGLKDGRNQKQRQNGRWKKW